MSELKIGDLVTVTNDLYIGFKRVGVVTRKKFLPHTVWESFDGMHYTLYICGRLLWWYRGDALKKVQ